MRTLLSLLLLGLFVSVPTSAEGVSPSSDSDSWRGTTDATAASCESFARRQVKLAGRLLDQNNFTRALKVLNSTMENCEREFIQKRIYRTLNKWYDSIAQNGSTSEFREFESTLANQKYLKAAQRDQLEGRLQGFVKSLIRGRFESENYSSTYQMCRKYSSATESNFELRYFCGTSAEKLGAVGAAMNAYEWMIDNWKSGQSVTTWSETAGKLESMYFRNGRFKKGYELARKSASLDPSPQGLLSALITMRATFLAPFVDVAAEFFGGEPGATAITHFNSQMQRVGLPKYVTSMYMLRSNGGLLRGMYGKQANQPDPSLLGQVGEATAFLTPSGNAKRAWLVSPVGDRYLVLEFTRDTTPEENILLERTLSNIRSDRAWQNLYDAQFKNAAPGVGSAIGAMLSSALVDRASFDGYNEVIEASPRVSYYTMQNEAEEVKKSYNFDRSKLGYGEKEWERSSTTPALYNHSIKYGDRSVREVVWPNFVNDEWSGVIRIGLVKS